MFLFPFIYTTAFAVTLFYLLKSKADRSLVFIIFGLPIYITTLSVTFMYGLGFLVPILQWFKEIVIGLAFVTVVFSMKKKPRLNLLDKLVIAYFAYIALYVFLPLGGASLNDKLIIFKNMAFFPFIYFTGRLIDPETVNLNRYFNYICLITIPAAAVVLWEMITYTHFQTFTGYADFMRYFYGVEPSGHHGLTWTFEAENDGPKRFASIFANPLDHAAGTLTAVCAILAMITTQTRKIQVNRFIILAFCCSMLSIIFALSRASFASYFIILYLYAYTTNRRAWLTIFHYGALAVLLVVFTFLTGDIYDFIVATLNFTSSSSAFHLLQWLDGIQAVAAHPLGMGLGTSGNLAGLQGNNVGGESQLIIIAVQCGLVALGLFLAIYFNLIRSAIRTAKTSTGKARRVAIFVLLLSSGMIIPFITAEAMSYLYVGYTLWFFAGLLTNIRSQQLKSTLIAQSQPA
jgi:hypothetical protein